MSIKKTEFKIEIILWICFVFLFLRVIPTVSREGQKQEKMWKPDISEEKKDEKFEDLEKQETEQTGSGMLIVEYITGNNLLLAREAGIYIPTPTIAPTAAPTPIPTEIPSPTDIPPVETLIQVADIIGKKYNFEDLRNITYLKDNLYIVNASTKMTAEDFDTEYFIKKDLSLSETENSEQPRILIFHTHASEGFSDSRKGVAADTVVGAGEKLANILQEKYGYHVLHDTTVFDLKNGKDNRNYAYNEALTYLTELLAKNPSIEVIIDLHRDAGTKRVATINGKQTAKVMLFNGLCRNTQGKLTYLPNKNLKDNLAFSFQMKLIGDEMYPGLMNRIFLKDYRYNMHLKERFLLIELGTEKNTVEEAMNAMEPLADVLHQVLGG